MQTRFPLEIFKSTQTPFYYYDLNLLNATLDAIEQEMAPMHGAYRMHYAIKANHEPKILQAIAARNMGADCVSGGEIQRAVEAGIKPENITYAGVGKTDQEIALGIDLGISCFNVESLQELDIINEIATSRGACVNVALRINPDIDAHTHHYITTGLEENKFGINLDKFESVITHSLTLKGVRVTGLHFHIGSQILTMEPFVILCGRAQAIMQKAEALGVTIKTINVGGGLGIDYDNPDSNPIPDFHGYFSTFRQHMALREDQSLHFELGRAIVAQCGSLISKVLYVKEGTKRKFAIIDAGMTDLIRPALYGAHHLIQNLTEPDAPVCTYDVVGPICESSDSFGQDERLPEVKRGSLLAIRSAGAYGEVMAMTYNCRTLAPAIYE